MKNVTISLDEKLHRETRVAAAKAGKSMSRYIAELLERQQAAGATQKGKANKHPQLEALERILAGPQWDITIDGRMPTAEERNERR